MERAADLPQGTLPGFREKIRLPGQALHGVRHARPYRRAERRRRYPDLRLADAEGAVVHRAVGQFTVLARGRLRLQG